MSYLSQEVINKSKAHARAEYPRESCGLVVDGSYMPCENMARPIVEHQEGNNDCQCQLCSFRIDPALSAKYQGRIDAVLHSHPNGPLFPSRADVEAQMQSGLVWGIICLDEERISEPMLWGDALPVQPLLGRQFNHFMSDCYTLIRDTYRLGRAELAKQGISDWPYDPILLPECPRDDAWWEGDFDLYTDNFPRAGFRQISSKEVRPGDVFLASIRSSKLNHGGLYLGNNLIMHHLPNRLSRREPVGVWGRYVSVWLRHDNKTGLIDA